ncbi:hypothetical protein CMI42_03385 [Candidatus Pacearchaeota archaeon]|nr:hypothetical protein [Candidatus Pacearchaeota archaeon]|tara:strand:+ start:766 stop:1395 length:630 start_codon:yes stop_codon:yes gene_type:complete
MTIIIINFKTYKKGKEVLKLVRIIEKINKNIIVGLIPLDIKEISKKTKLKVFSQYLSDDIKEIKGSASGVFLNHSDHPLTFNKLKKSISLCKKNKLKTAVFTTSLREARKIEKLKPTYLIYEPKELIGGKISVSQAKPEIIRKFKDNLSMTFLVGAGIKTSKDIKTALDLGSSGIAISSVIMKSRNPEGKLKELIGSVTSSKAKYYYDI